jgi:hypothetical protein
MDGSLEGPAAGDRLDAADLPGGWDEKDLPLSYESWR